MRPSVWMSRSGPSPEVGNGRLTVHNRVIPRQIHPRASQHPLPPCSYLPAEIAFEHFLEGVLQRVSEMRLRCAAAPAAGVEIFQKIPPVSDERRQRPSSCRRTFVGTPAYP